MEYGSVLSFVGDYGTISNELAYSQLKKILRLFIKKNGGKIPSAFPKISRITFTHTHPFEDAMSDSDTIVFDDRFSLGDQYFSKEFRNRLNRDGWLKHVNFRTRIVYADANSNSLRVKAFDLPPGRSNFHMNYPLFEKAAYYDLSHTLKYFY